jgi:hypothetical protein
MPMKRFAATSSATMGAESPHGLLLANAALEGPLFHGGTRAFNFS